MTFPEQPYSEEDLPCTCGECGPEVVTKRISKGHFIAIIEEMPFVVGRGKTRHRASMELLPFWDAAVNNLN